MVDENLLKPDTCFLHIIDVQESLMKQIHNADGVADVVLLMLRCARIMGMPVLANTQYKKGLGPYVGDLEEEVQGVPRPDKVEFNAFANKETASRVSRLPAPVTNMLIVGVETHICVCQTALGALSRGIKPYIVSDGVSSRHPRTP